MTTLLFELPPVLEPVETNFKSVNFPNGIILFCREFDPFSATEDNPKATRDVLVYIDHWTTNTGAINDDGRMKARTFSLNKPTPPFGEKYIYEDGVEVLGIVEPKSGLISYLDGWEDKWTNNTNYLPIKPEDREEYTIVSRFGWFLFHVIISQWSEDMTQIKLKSVIDDGETNWLDVANLRRSSW